MPSVDPTRPPAADAAPTTYQLLARRPGDHRPVKRRHDGEDGIGDAVGRFLAEVPDATHVVVTGGGWLWIQHRSGHLQGPQALERRPAPLGRARTTTRHLRLVAGG